MRVWLFSIVRNEAKIMPYFLRHYIPWVEKLIFYDDQSDDGTREMLKACPKVDLRDWPGSHGIVDDEFTEFANEQWKEARGHADWVVWVDADEFVYHREILCLLGQYLNEGVQVPHITGYTMVSDKFPTTSGQIYDEIRTGIYDPCWSKNAIFRANMHWNVGRHSMNLTNFRPRMSDTVDLKLLHYRCLGMEYLEWRHRRNWERVPDRCRARAYGTNCSPGHQGHHGVEWFRNIDRSTLIDVI